MRIHSGEKPFSCRYCSKSFVQKYNLQIHERIHTKYKPFQCEICSKQFSALGNFQAHLKIHTGVRDYHCQVCQKSFYTGGDLTKHMVTHTGIRSHHCDVCSRSFSRFRDMRAHKRKVHQQPAAERSEDEEDEIDTVVNDDIFKCPQCDKEFNSSNSLSIHFRTHGGTNLLNLPLTSTQMSLSHAAAASSHHHAYTHHHPHHHHPHHLAGTSLGIHEDLHTHLGLSSVPAMQTNPIGTHMAMLGAPPHVPHPPPTEPQLTMMHTAQRLHPY